MLRSTSACAFATAGSAVALALFVLSFAPGCSSRETVVERATREGRLLLGNGAEPEDLDPHIVTGLPEFRIVSTLFEGLTAYSADTRTVVPGVAASWEVAPDGSRWTFWLREDARWSNGDPVTAHDFEFGWRRVLTPGVGNRYTYLYEGIRGALEFARGEVPWEETGIRAVDAHTLQVEFVQPVPYFDRLITHQTFYPVHRPTLEAHGAVATRGTAWTRPGNLVGNGPFQLHAWRHNEFIEVRPNPHYWDRGRVALSSVRFFPIDSLDTEERAFRTGQLHVTSSVPPHRIPRLRESGAPELRISPMFAVYFLNLNNERPPLDDPRVRRALALAIDRNALVRQVTQGGEIPAYNLLPPDIFAPDSPPGFTADADEARRLLATAGFPGGAGFPRLEYLYNTSESHRAIAEAIQQMWRRELGIDIVLSNQEWQVYLASQRAGQFWVSRAGWVASYHDGTVFSNLLLSHSGNNNARFHHAGYDQVATAVRHELDPAERRRQFQRAGEILVEQMPIVPLYYYTAKRLVHPAVAGWHDSPLDIHPLKYVCLTGAAP
jgi:oligopeptide transport system substrate-binding protein